MLSLKSKMNKQDIKNIILKNNKILEKNKIKAIALFGSYVRNKPKQNSDVDFLIEFKEPTYDNYIGLRDDLKKILHKRVDIINKNALNKKIKTYILNEAEWIIRR